MIPDVEGADDTSYFEEYEDDDEHTDRVRKTARISCLHDTSDTQTSQQFLLLAVQISHADQQKFADF